MSRNKDIKLLHDMTGLDYSICRRRMKAHRWDLAEALELSDALRVLNRGCGILDEVIDDLAKAMKNVADAAIEALDEIVRRAQGNV